MVHPKPTALFLWPLSPQLDVACHTIPFSGLSGFMWFDSPPGTLTSVQGHDGVFPIVIEHVVGFFHDRILEAVQTKKCQA
jgi:hypothetical protein